MPRENPRHLAMSEPAINDSLLGRMKTAATQRARGKAWVDVAKACSRSKSTVEKWPNRHTEQWNELLDEQLRIYHEEITGEALATIQELIQPDHDDDIRLRAALGILTDSTRRLAIITKRKVELSGKVKHEHTNEPSVFDLIEQTALEIHGRLEQLAGSNGHPHRSS